MKKRQLLALLLLLTIGSVAWAQNITFADANVKAICVANWDANGNGELSYYEAANVPELGTVFTNNVNIKEFTELQFFIGLNSIGTRAFSGCSGLTSIIIPESVDVIGSNAFEGCSGLTSIIIPESVTRIGLNAFEGCSGLTSIIIPESVTRIDDGAFKGCSGLTSIIIPEGVTSIGYAAFQGCSALTSSISIPEGVTNIEAWAFAWCNGLSSITLPDGLTSIGNHAFYGCSGLTSITIPEGVTGIGYYAFYGCSGLTSIVIDEGNTAYTSANGANAIIEKASNTLILGCKNTVIPESVDVIGSNAFEGCSGLTSITIPEGVTRIGGHAFAGCSGLTSITIPEGVTDIGQEAFLGCSGLTSIVADESNTVYTSANGANAIIEKASNTLILGCKNTVIPEGVTGIGYYAFAGCSGLTSITIPEGVTGIGAGAFHNCSGLTSITIPESVTSIEWDAFQDCSSLTGIVVDEGNTVYTSANGANAIIEKASNNLILGCKNTIIPEGVTSIGEFAFSGCSGLTSITIPESVTSIGFRAFSDCSGLTSITIPKGVSGFIVDEAFLGCTGLTEVLSMMEELYSRWDYDRCWDGVHTDEIPLYVPKGTKQLYEATEGWNVFKNIIEKDDAFFVNNAVYVNDTVARNGGKLTLSLKMKNTAAIRGFQFDLYLPEGVTVAKSSKGKILGALSEGRLPDEDEHSLTFSEQPDGAIRFLCSSQYDETFTGNDGEIATLQLNIAEGMAAGDYEIQLKNMKLTESDIEKHYDTALLRSRLTVMSIVLGDINSDKLVDVSDYTGVANHIHGATPNGFVFMAADVDENNTIDVSDYTGIANIIHTGNIYGIKASREMSRSPKKENTDLSGNDNVIYVEPFAVTPGTPTTISIKMKNTAEIRGFQFDLYLPEGMTVVKSSRGKIQGALNAGRLPEEDEHELTFSERPDGAIRFLCSSQYDETFTGTDGEIATLQVNVAEGMADGNYPLLLKNMKLTETDIRNYYETDEVETTVSVLSTAEVLKGDVTGEGNVNAADVTALVNYILGRGTLANEPAAYVNDDTKIDIQDVTALIELVK